MGVKIELLRPDDLLHLRVEAANLRVDADEALGAGLVVDDPQQPAFLIFNFPPQTIAERAYFEASIVQPEADPRRLNNDSDKGSTAIEAPGLPGQTPARIGEPSRLVFKVPADGRIPFSTEGLLDWSNLELSVNPIAAIGPEPTAEQIANAPAIREPAPNETAIELPYRLMISPNAGVAWQHRTGLFTARGRTELWHTRVALKTAEGGIAELSRERRAPLRAIWSDDYNPDSVPPPAKQDPDLGRTAMSPNDRHQIVVLTSAFRGYEVEVDLGLRPFARLGLFQLTLPYTPGPFEAEQLMLSPLGGWLRSGGRWTPPRVARRFIRPAPNFEDLVRLLRFEDVGGDAPGGFAAEVFEEFPPIFRLPEPAPYQLDLSEWAHIATQGRDHYVRIVYEGKLVPFENRASLVKVTERKFKKQNGVIGAYLFQRMFIVVRQPVVTFAKTDRSNPFKQVRLTTLVTPDIAPPVTIGGTQRSFWVEVMTSPTTRADFKFHAVGTDVSGNQVDFTASLMFMSLTDEDNARPAVAVEYNEPANSARRRLVVPGQKMMFAAADADPARRNDNTQFVTQTLNFVVDPAGRPPRLFNAEVKIPQVQELLGTDAPTMIRLFKGYVDNGFDAASGVFAEVVKEDFGQFKPDDPFAALVATTLGVNFSSDKAGGFATPNLAVSTLTRALGPLAGQVQDALTGTFDPQKFFPPGLAMLFGSFDLSKLLPAGALEINAPKLRTETADMPGGKLLRATLDWEPGIEAVDAGPARFHKDHGGIPSQLTVHGTIEKPLRPEALPGPPPGDSAKMEFSGRLNNFRVSVLESVFVNFSEFTFHSRGNQKTDVKVTLDPATPVEFAGDLKFVEELRKAIPPNLFGKGPSLDISPTGIRAGFALALPPASVGVFALKDVSLGAALTLPFLDGKPVFDFNVSERQHPFLLTVALFAGGGFFHLQLDTAGIKQLEAAFEFGAAAAIDIGVASGEVHIMAGIYFSMQRKENSLELMAVLAGYLRIGGALSVLGLVKISVEFNLSFIYDGVRDKAYGRATLTVQVEVAMFSKSVELTVERAFGGKSGDPKFGEVFTTPETWSDYALAFA